MGNTAKLCGKIDEQTSSTLYQKNTHQQISQIQTTRARTIEKISSKPIFHKINQLLLHKEDSPCEISVTEEDEPELSPRHCDHKDKYIQETPEQSDNHSENEHQHMLHCPSLEDLLLGEEHRLELRKIGVNWNSFVKIKKKSYLEDYVFIKEIGKGAYGSVVKIKMKYGGMLRAAKLIKSALVTAEKANIGKLLAEISLPMRLDHPNLVKLFEVFDYRGQYVLIMELCEGGDLFSYIKKSRFFSENKAAHIIKQILSAVNYMHKQGIVHRDLKPENILVDAQSDTLKIGDFGTATLFDEASKLHEFVGTPYYIAPEVIDMNYNQKCDVWSCGIILYILLSGSPPFNGKNDRDIMERIKLKPLDFKNPIWNKRNKLAKELVVRMLTKNPEDRISAEQALNNPWLTNSTMQTSTKSKTDVEMEVISNLQSFHFKNKLKAVVYTYIASQLYSNRDKDNLMKVFKEIDRDGDGVIEKSQLIQVFNSHSTSRLTENEIQQILQLIDTNGSGHIDFTEFLVAASNQEKLLEQKRLQNAFNYLDADHSGFISMEQIKAFLDGTNQTSDEIKQIFDQVDENGDGNISKQEFIALLLKRD